MTTSILTQLLVAVLRVDCKAGKMEWKQGEQLGGCCKNLDVWTRMWIGEDR